MNAQQARALITETFPQPFDEGRYRSFAINLLNHIDESKAQAWNTTYIKDAFKGHVRGYKRLGTYTSPEKEKVDVLIVHLTTEAKLERARTAIRNFVADHLKTRDNKDAALVAFVSPTEKQWRLSFVKMEYAAVEKEGGKVGVQTKLTPARRSSYIVGEGESCHTAQSRFLDLLQDTENHPTLAQIEDAFSVEAVTREFFEQYKALFLDLKDELDDLAKKRGGVGTEFTSRGISTADFGKKLMGQIVFLYFMQKKGWLGVPKRGDWGDGPHDFLRQLFDGKFGPYENFFNDILEPLFYDTLATDRGHEAWGKTLNCRIPFLNGGLFEPLAGYDWEKTDIIIPNALFSNTKTAKAGDTGTGILDVFDRYNFTVNEAEPLEKEVAIDPEMLGKVFENLLEVKERKSKGSFYTPREIVHYMCQESLINYLDAALNTAEESIARAKPKQTKFFGDPEPGRTSLKTTVRREIVPPGDIETFVHLGDQISHYEAVETPYAIKMPKSLGENARLIDEKLADITVCDPAVGSGAFPVGMMHEIVRARSALTPYFNDVHDRTTYHFKRHAIQNCLYGVDIDPGAVEIAKLRLWLSLVVDEDDVQQIKPLPNLDFKIVVGNSLMGFPFKSPRLHEIEKLKARFFEETDHNLKVDMKRDIERKLSECFAASKKSLGYEVTFDFEVWFSEVFDRKSGFDVVIANPPYVRHETISEMAPVLRQRFTVAASRADLLIFFYEQGVNLLRAGGVLTLITSNKFHRAAYGSKLRPFLTGKLQIETLIDFGDAPVFEAIAYASILIGRKGDAAGEHQIRACTWLPENDLSSLPDTLAREGIGLAQNHLAPDGWRLESPVAIHLLEKLRKTGTPLGEYVGGMFYRGIITGLNEAFVLTREQRDDLIVEDGKSAELIKPYIRGRDVKRWMVHYHDLYLIVFPHGFHGELKNYPAILRHLTRFQAQLKERGQCKSSRGSKEGGQHHWLELDNNPKTEYLALHYGPKLIYPELASEPRFAFDSDGLAVDCTLYMIPTGSWFLAACMNSAVSRYVIRQIGAVNRGGYMRFKKQYMESIPIPPASGTDKANLTKLAQRAATAATAGDDAAVARIEREIDETIYRLFGLTPDEIARIEKSLVNACGDGAAGEGEDGDE